MRALADPDAVQVGIDDASPVIPLEACKLNRADNGSGQFTTPGVPVAVVTKRSLGSVSCLGPFDESLPVVAFSQGAAKLEIIPPEFEFTRRGVTRSDERCLPAVGGGLLMGEAPEALINDIRDVLVKQPGPDGWPLAATDLQTGVGHEAVGVDGALENVAAFRTPGDACEQPVVVSPAVVADTMDGVGGVPQFLRDDRFPGVGDVASAWPSEVAERRDGLHDAHECRVRPCPAAGTGDPVADEVSRNLPPAHTSSPLAEDAMHDGSGHGVYGKLSLSVASVAVWGADGVAARCVGSDHGCSDLLVGLISLPFGHDEQQSEHGAPHGGRGVDAFRDGHHTGAPLVQLVDRCESADDGAGEPVEPRDHDSLGRTLLDAFQCGPHTGTFHGAAGAVEVFVDLGDPNAMSFRPAPDCVTLCSGRLEPISGPAGDLGHADIAVHHWVSGHAVRILPIVGSSGATDNDPHRKPPRRSNDRGRDTEGKASVQHQRTSAARLLRVVQPGEKLPRPRKGQPGYEEWVTSHPGREATAIRARRAQAKSRKRKRELEGRWNTIYKLYDAKDRLLYVGISVSAVNRMAGHRGASPWFRQVVRAEFEHVKGREAALLRELELIRELDPKWNRAGKDRPPSISPEPARAAGFLL